MSNAYDTSRGNSRDRQRRRAWLLEAYRADVDVFDGSYPGTVRKDVMGVLSVPRGQGDPACRCYQCGVLLILEALTVDRIVPGCLGGTYKRSNIRPSCASCAGKQGGELSAQLRDKG